MTSGLRSLIIFALGAVTGGSVAAFITHDWAKKKYTAEADDKVKSLEEYIDKLRSEQLTSDLDYIHKGSVASDDNDAAGDPEEGSTVRKVRILNDRAYVDYTQYSKGSEDSGSKGLYSGSKVDEMYDQIAAGLEHPVDSDEDEEPGEAYDLDEEEAERERQEELSYEWTKEVNSKRTPELITYEDFGSTGHMDEVYLNYYMEDGIVAVDDTNEIIENPEDLLGDILDRCGFATNNERVLHIRNYSRATDYEISKVWGSFQDMHE